MRLKGRGIMLKVCMEEHPSLFPTFPPSNSSFNSITCLSNFQSLSKHHQIGSPANVLLMDPVFPSIGTVFKLTEFCLALKEVEPENLVFLRLIARVRKDLDEACRERRDKETAFLQKTKSSPAARPQKLDWINDAILDARAALNEIGSLIEKPRIDAEDGIPVRLRHRFEWVLQNHARFVSRQLLLATCHQSLLAAIIAMQSLPACSSSSSSDLLDPAPEPEPEHVQMLPSPSRRRPLECDVTVSELPVASSPDEDEPSSCSSLPVLSISSSPVEAGGEFDSYESTIQDFELYRLTLKGAPFESSQPTPPHTYEHPPGYSASWLPMIRPISISWDDILSIGEHDEGEAMSAAADTLDAYEGDLSNASEMVHSLCRTVTLKQGRSVAAKSHSVPEGESKTGLGIETVRRR